MSLFPGFAPGIPTNQSPTLTRINIMKLTLVSKVKSLLMSRKGKSGQTLVEYALILAFISVVAILVLQQLGTQVKDVFGTIKGKLQQAQTAS